MSSTSDPAALLGTFDIFDPDHVEPAWDVLSLARSRCPVMRTTADAGYYLVTRFDDVRTVLEDPATFSSLGVSPRPNPVRLPPLDVDPPLHAEFRAVLNSYFSRSYLLRYADRMRAIADQAIDAFADTGRCEFVTAFAIPYTSTILARIVFDEGNEDRVRRAVEAVNRVGHEGSPEAYAALADLAAQYFRERQQPGQRDPGAPDGSPDLMTAIAGARVGGREMTLEERLGVVTVLFLGGLDTSRGAITNIASCIAADPSLERRVLDPRWIRGDMDEFIRYQSPVLALGRRVTRATVLGGIPLEAGDQLLVHFGSANRDSDRFPDADHLVFDSRRPGHAGFGLGIHRCIGSNLARLQIEIAFERLLRRLTNLRIEPDGGPDYAPGVVCSPTRLELTFDRR
jgi:cytochrome P450